MEGPHWDEAIEKFWQENQSEEEYMSLVYFRDPAQRETFIPVIWGSEVIDNRLLRFLVSGPDNVDSSDWRPRKVIGADLGREWDGALERYWTERANMQHLRFRSLELRKHGIGPLQWLDEIDEAQRPLSPELSSMDSSSGTETPSESSSDSSTSDDDSNGEDKENEADAERRDSGGTDVDMEDDVDMMDTSSD